MALLTVVLLAITATPQGASAFPSNSALRNTLKSTKDTATAAFVTDLRRSKRAATVLFSTPTKGEEKKSQSFNDDDEDEEGKSEMQRQLTFRRVNDKEGSLLNRKFDEKRGEFIVPTTVTKTSPFDLCDDNEEQRSSIAANGGKNGTITTAATEEPLPVDRSEFDSDCAALPGETVSMENADVALRLMKSELGVSRVVKGDNFPMGREGTLPLDVIFERTLDTLEDATLHARRMPHEMGWVDDMKTFETKDDRPTVVVLGSGWASHAFIKVADAFQWRIIVVSPSNHFVFTPMLASAAVGTVEYRSMTEAVRASNPMIDSYIEGKAVGIDIEKQTLDVELNSLLEDVKSGSGKPSPIQLKYDKLLVAVGVKVADRMVPGAREYCMRLKSCDDARQLRTSIGEALEYASRPDCRNNPEERRRRATFAIVGGGPTGVELAGELSDFIKDITKPRKGTYPHLHNDTRVVLVHGGNDLVPAFDPKLREHALDSLKRRGIEVILNARVQEVKENSVLYYDKNDSSKTVQTLDVGLTAWCAGTQQIDFVQKMLNQLPDEAKGKGGRVNVDRWMRCPTGSDETFGSILILGDAASCPENSHPDAPALPQTAQVAGQQGAYAARLLCRGYDLSVTPPRLTEEQLKDSRNLLAQWLQIRGLTVAPRFDFLNLGLLAYVGGGEALTQVQIGDVPVFSYAGSVAFVLWRSVYLVKQVATRNRVLVTFDWIKSALFGRDITRL